MYIAALLCLLMLIKRLDWQLVPFSLLFYWWGNMLKHYDIVTIDKYRRRILKNKSGSPTALQREIDISNGKILFIVNPNGEIEMKYL